MYSKPHLSKVNARVMMMSYDAPTQAMQPQAIEDISKYFFNDLLTHIHAKLPAYLLRCPYWPAA